jgi:hypothetical protein
MGTMTYYVTLAFTEQRKSWREIGQREERGFGLDEASPSSRAGAGQALARSSFGSIDDMKA